MKAEEIIKEIAMLAGIDLPAAGGGSPTEPPGLRERIMAEIEGCAREAIIRTPRSRLTGWRLLPTDELMTRPDGSRLLPLPDDFLLLHSVAMTDWEMEATETLEHDHWLSLSQRGNLSALKASPSRPMAVTTLTPSGSPALLLYGSRDEEATAGGWYMPLPRIDEAGEIEIPPACTGIFRELILHAIGQAHDIFHTDSP